MTRHRITAGGRSKALRAVERLRATVQRLSLARLTRYHQPMKPLRTVWVVLALLLASAAWAWVGRHGEASVLVVDTGRIAISNSTAPGDIDDDAWRPLDLRVLAGMTGPYWVRFDLDLRPGAATDTALALRLSMRAASEVYWNGRLLGRNGRVGTSADTERPGRIDWTVPIPASDALPGRHQLLLRGSSFHTGFSPARAELGFKLAPIDELYGRVYARWLIAAIALGAVAVSGMYFAAIRRQRQRPGLAAERLLVLLGVVGMLLPIVESWRTLVGYTYQFHPLRLYLLLALTVAAAALLPAYLHVRAGGRVRRDAAAGFGLLVVLIVSAAPSLDGRSLLLHLLGLLASLVIVLRARDTADPDRYPVIALLATTVGLLLIDPSAFLDGLYFIALAVLMTFLLLRHAAHIAGLDEKIAQLQMQRSRLSAELLQRNIHPHWLMNTLTSLQELVEEAPARASRMIELLAGQFARMRAFGERSVIPLHEEIAMCRAHLDIVGTMHDRHIPFDIDGDTPAIELPPGMLHALVENALTHAGVATCADVGFRLQVHRHDQHVVIELRAAQGKGGSDGIVERTGTHFIRASLAAAYPAGARFEHRGDGRCWHSRIELPCAS